MRSEIGFAALALIMMGGLVWWTTTLDDGPAITGPDEAQVVVENIPNPAVGGSPSASDDPWALPAGFRQLLDRDAIAPIYGPVYTTADDSTWPDNALVVGVALNGEARAYPVGYLNRREMVLDEIGGIPVLVSW